MYEIEHRALLTEEQYTDLKARLESNAITLGADDKEVAYYIFTDKLLKVSRNVSKGTCILSLKLNTLGNGSSFQEFELPFAIDAFDTMRSICESISDPDQVIFGTQKRTNYKYEDVEIALKWSEDWGYHVEFEKVIADLKDKDEADASILKVAEEFSVRLMTEEEVAAFSNKVRSAKK